MRRSGRGTWPCPPPPHAPPPPLWLLELAGQLRLIEPGTPLPTGVIVGSAVIEKVTPGDGVYRWHLRTISLDRNGPQEYLRTLHD